MYFYPSPQGDPSVYINQTFLFSGFYLVLFMGGGQDADWTEEAKVWEYIHLFPLAGPELAVAVFF